MSQTEPKDRNVNNIQQELEATLQDTGSAIADPKGLAEDMALILRALTKPVDPGNKLVTVLLLITVSGGDASPAASADLNTR